MVPALVLVPVRVLVLPPALLPRRLPCLLQSMPWLTACARTNASASPVSSLLVFHLRTPAGKCTTRGSWRWWTSHQTNPETSLVLVAARQRLTNELYCPC